MEHRKEIVIESSSKDIFFQNHLVENQQPQIYSLEEEFAKTTRNRDFKPYLIFFGFILLLVICTVAIANYLETKSKLVNIDISDFEDLQLKETLSSAKETEQELNKKTAELTIKTKELNIKSKELNSKTQELNLKKKELITRTRELSSRTQELSRLSATFDTQVQKIREQIQQEADLKNADKKAQKRLEDKSKKQLDEIKKDYDKQISAKQTAIYLLQQQVKDLASYQYGLNSFLKGLKASGCVIDARQQKNVVLYFPKTPKLSGETIAEVYRAKDEYIGKLKLTPGGSGLKAEVVETVRGQDIKPWDWFRL